MPAEITNAEKFIEMSASAKFCVVKRLKTEVKLKLRTPKRMYTLKVEPGKAEETINGYSRRLRHLAKNTDINDPETGEAEKIGDDFIELWKEIQKKQHNLPTYLGLDIPLYG